MSARIASLLWLIPAIVFSIVVLGAPSHAHRPAAALRPPSHRSESGPIDPQTARRAFDVLVGATETTCALEDVTTESDRIDVRWRHGDEALPPAIVRRAWVDSYGTDRLVVEVPTVLRAACPRAAAGLDALGDRVPLAAASVDPTGEAAPIHLATARWLWIAIAFTLALVVRWVVLAMRDDDQQPS